MSGSRSILRTAQAATLAWLAFPALAQFTVEGVPVHVHGFFSQGFMYSQGNNYMTMPTTQGSFAFTDGGINLSARINDKLWVGAQAYDRNIGAVGNGNVTLDWASADYRFNDHLGIRAGKVKTVFGLYNDTQDLEFLHTWALLPQSIYPLDLRGIDLAHIGGDVYGSVSPKSLGTFSYTAYAGIVPPDSTSGYSLGLAAYGFRVGRLTGTDKGGDLKWATPLSGFTVGIGYTFSPAHFDCDNLAAGISGRVDTSTSSSIVSAQYTRGAWRIDAEYNRQSNQLVLTNVLGTLGPPVELDVNPRAWYVAAAHRFSKCLEVGAYYSQYSPNDEFLRVYPNLPLSTGHLYDPAVTVRFDWHDRWDLKLEGHHIDGGGDPTAFRGIYPQDNPDGIKPRTNLLVVRLGFNI